MVGTGMGKSVAVTGMAWTTALGDDLRNVWGRLLFAETGITDVVSQYTLRNTLAAAIPVPRIKSESDRIVELGVSTAKRAMADAGLDSHIRRPWLIVGTSLGDSLSDHGSETPLDEWAGRIAKLLGCDNRVISISTACSSGSDAIIMGAILIREGIADVCVCGGVDVLSEPKRLAHSALGTMSPTCLRPFDKRHDGTLLGEGAAFLVLDARDTVTPDENMYARLRGYGAANDATGLTAPDISGRTAAEAMSMSLANANLTPDMIGVVNAHGSGTPVNDALEQEALGIVFEKAAKPVVFGTKGAFGHTLGATGAIEAIALILALKHRCVPPTAGLEDPVGDFPLPLARGLILPCPTRFGLSLTLGFGGFDTSLIFEATT